MLDGTSIATIIGAVLGFAGTIVAAFFGFKKALVTQSVKLQKIQDDIDGLKHDQARLEKKIDEHNGYAKRFGEIEKAAIRTDTRLENIEKRLK